MVADVIAKRELEIDAAIASHSTGRRRLHRGLTMNPIREAELNTTRGSTPAQVDAHRELSTSVAHVAA